MKKKITLKKSTPTPLEAYAVKLCPPDVQPELCAYGLPLFVRDRRTAISEACVMLNHMNIRPEIARLRYLGRYDNVRGFFTEPKVGENYEANLAEALAEVAKGDIAHEAKQG